MNKVRAFVAICVIAVGGLAGYLYLAGTRGPAPAPLPTAGRAAAAGRESAPLPDNRMFFRYTGVDAHYGMLAHASARSVAQPTFVDTLQCEVVHVSGGRGLCLTADRGVFTTYAATLFDARTYATIATLALKGIPSRCRVSLDGKLAALTVFVTGHGYTALDFSTQTLLIDMEQGKALADLEEFVVTRAGVPIKSADFNFWGVTFTPDAKTFYATLSTAGQHYLVRGNVAAKTAELIHDNVECPSLSPDARRIAYKKRFMIDRRIVWQLHVLDLASGRETALSERRSIDDQLEWLDDARVLYSVPSEDASGASTDVWVAPADASTAPALFVRNAYSPAVERGMRPGAASALVTAGAR